MFVAFTENKIFFFLIWRKSPKKIKELLNQKVYKIRPIGFIQKKERATVSRCPFRYPLNNDTAKPYGPPNGLQINDHYSWIR
jgi:hypothetical protein